MTSSTIDLWEVIAEPSLAAAARGARGEPFGQTFHDKATATAYARALRRAGYIADVSTVFATTPDLADAMQAARSFFEDEALAETSA